MKSTLFFIVIAGTLSMYPSVVFAGLQEQLEVIRIQAIEIQTQLRRIVLDNPITAQPSSAKWQVALQIGHWKLDERPQALNGLNPLRQARGGGKIEWEVNLAIARETAKRLEQQGIEVTLLPAALPGIYRADAFVAIHADQIPNDPFASGFKVAASAFDESGRAGRLALSLYEEYEKATWLPRETYIPMSMPLYYAFNYVKYPYAIHPDTPSAIIETGYLPSARDRIFLVDHPNIAAAGIANGIVKFLEEHGE